MKRSICEILVVIFLFTLPMYADIYMVNKQHTDGMEVMGRQQADQDVIQKVWITKDKIKSDSENQSVIIFLNEGKMVSISHSEKTYTELPMNFGNMMQKAMEKQTDQDKQEMEQFMQMMKFDITVTETKESKTINNWKCKKYNQEVKMGMGPINSVVWATEDLKMDYEVYAKFSTAMMSMQPGFSDSFEKAMKEMRKIKGVGVYRNNN